MCYKPGYRRIIAPSSHCLQFLFLICLGSSRTARDKHSHLEIGRNVRACPLKMSVLHLGTSSGRYRFPFLAAVTNTELWLWKLERSPCWGKDGEQKGKLWLLKKPLPSLHQREFPRARSPQFCASFPPEHFLIFHLPSAPNSQLKPITVNGYDFGYCVLPNRYGLVAIGSHKKAVRSFWLWTKFLLLRQIRTCVSNCTGITAWDNNVYYLSLITPLRYCKPGLLWRVCLSLSKTKKHLTKM